MILHPYQRPPSTKRMQHKTQALNKEHTLLETYQHKKKINLLPQQKQTKQTQPTLRTDWIQTIVKRTTPTKPSKPWKIIITIPP